MSLFSRALYENDSSSFTPLFRLLDDFDSYNRQGDRTLHTRGRDRSSGLAFWQPKFDISESRDGYELHGDLPGMKKDDIHIEFPEPQTVVVRGKLVRTQTVTSPDRTVEDVSDNIKSITGDGAAAADSNVQQQQLQATDKLEYPKYWLRERQFGEFSRTFNFPSAVDQDNISAGFKDGVLSMSVPKAKKPQARRIAIN